MADNLFKPPTKLKGLPPLLMVNIGDGQVFNRDEVGKAMVQFVVSSEAAAGSGHIVRVEDTEGNPVASVFPQTNVTFETDGAFSVKLRVIGTTNGVPNPTNFNVIVGQLILRGTVGALDRFTGRFGPDASGSGSGGAAGREFVSTYTRAGGRTSPP